jgi:hypothetical protein
MGPGISSTPTLVSDARIGDHAMGLATLAEHTGTIGGLMAAAGVALRYGLDAALRLAAGITAICARDEQSRAQRALTVLRVLARRDEPPPPPEASDTPQADPPP